MAAVSMRFPWRALAAAFAVGAGVAAAAVVVAVHPAGSLPGPVAVMPAPSRGCDVPPPSTAAGYARALGELGQAGDATLSVRLPSGHVAWIFADTFMPGVGFPHSTVVMQDGGCLFPTRRQLLPDDADGTYWWPGAAAALPGGDVLITASNGYGHRTRAAIAREVESTLVFDHWLTQWPQTPDHGPLFIAGLLVDGPVLRVYGTRLTGTTFGKELYLATVPLSGLASGRGWQVGTQPVFGAAPHGTDTAVAAYRDASGYHLVTLLDGVFGGGPLVSLDSASPAGPFTVRPLLTYSRPGQWRYNAAVHPEAALADGRLLVTVNNNWPWTDRSVHPLATYQPSYFAVAR